MTCCASGGCGRLSLKHEIGLGSFLWRKMDMVTTVIIRCVKSSCPIRVRFVFFFNSPLHFLLLLRGSHHVIGFIWYFITACGRTVGGGRGRGAGFLMGRRTRAGSELLEALQRGAGFAAVQLFLPQREPGADLHQEAAKDENMT